MIGVIFILLLIISQLNIFFLKDYISDGNVYVIKQLVFSIVAIILYLSIKNYSKPKQILNFINILFIINIVLLLVVFFSPYKIRATRRWIDLDIVSIQPGELLKLTLPVFLVVNLYTTKIFQQIGLIFVALFSISLVLLAPNLSNTIILGVAFFMIFILNPFINIYRKLYIFVFLIIVCVTLVRFNLKPYHFARIEAFLNPAEHQKTTSYQTTVARKLLSQIGFLRAIDVESAKKQFQLLPKEKHNDFVFVSLVYNFGKISGIAVIFIYLVLFILLVDNLYKIDSKIIKLLFIGYTTIISIQTIASLSINLTILPVAGITLPFLSYGGSSLLTFTTLLAMMDNKYFRTIKFLYE